MCKLQESNLSKLQETKKFKKREPKNKLSKSSDNKLVWDDEKFMLFEELCAKFCEQKEIADLLQISEYKVSRYKAAAFKTLKEELKEVC